MNLVLRIINGIKHRVNNRLFPKSQLERLKERGLIYGRNFNFLNSYIDYGHCWLIEIGDDVTITNSTILAHDASTKRYLGKAKIGKVKIGNRVFIGWNSLVLCNVRIGDDVIIGAGSVVTRDIPNNSVAVGNPARVIGKTSDFISRHKENLKTKKVYDTYEPYKTKQQITQIIEELDSDFGYDE